jgi:uncharacterized membrane protein
MPKQGLLSQIADNPATQGLGKAVAGYASAKVESIGKGKSKPEPEQQEGDSPGLMERVKGGAVEGTGESMQEGGNKVFGAITGAVKGLFSKAKGAAKRPTNILESYFLPMSADEAFQAWTDYEEHAGYMKGVESVKVTEGDDGQIESSWSAKIWWSRRSWKSTEDERVDGQRVRWHSEANKGTVDGTVMFTPLGEHACMMTVLLEYRPKGFMEWMGNRWRTVGRRARLDVKHWERHMLMQDHADHMEGEDGAEAEDQGPQDEEQDTPPPPDPDHSDDKPVTSSNRERREIRSPRAPRTERTPQPVG